MFKKKKHVILVQVCLVLQSTPSPSADLLGIRSAAPVGAAPAGAGSLLVDVFSEAGPAAPSTAVNDDGFLRCDVVFV